jgi:hypothetical protein
MRAYDFKLTHLNRTLAPAEDWQIESNGRGSKTNTSKETCWTTACPAMLDSLSRISLFNPSWNASIAHITYSRISPQSGLDDICYIDCYALKIAHWAVKLSCSSTRVASPEFMSHPLELGLITPLALAKGQSPAIRSKSYQPSRRYGPWHPR